MATHLFVHFVNDDPIVVEVDEMPNPTDTYIVGTNPELRDGKTPHYIAANVTTILIPWHRVSFVEILPTGEEEQLLTPARD